MPSSSRAQVGDTLQRVPASGGGHRNSTSCGDSLLFYSRHFHSARVIISVHARCTEGVTGSKGREGADRGGGGIGVGGGNGDGYEVGGGNGGVNDDRNGDGRGNENGCGGERTNARWKWGRERGRVGNGNRNGGVEARGRTQDGNRDGSWNGKESNSGDGIGDGDGTGMGKRTGSWREEKR